MNIAATTNSARAADHNPFSASCVRPGAIDYLFADGASAGQIVDRLRAYCWRGAIIGPHGSGKSTLLKTLAPALAERKIVELELRSRPNPNHALAEFLRTRKDASGDNDLIVVDGYEQLGYWSRWKLRRYCRRHKAGLLVTAHRPCSLPTLLTTSTNLQTARQIVRRILPAGDATITDDDVAACFRAQQGNMRETLFALYDIYQQRRRPSNSKCKPPERER